MAKSTYKKDYSRHGPTPQTKPIPGRESEMARTEGGGVLFKTGDWQQLDRFLKFGSAGGTYYVGESRLTWEAGQLIDRCLREDGRKTVDMIVETSVSGASFRQDQVIFALALACSVKHGDHKKDTADPKDPLRLTREYALAQAPKVLRTGSHMLMFMDMLKQQRGWGKGLRNLVRRWYCELSPPHRVAFQVTKYGNRNTWTHRDVLRLAHPKAESEDLNKLFGRVVSPNDAEKSAAAAQTFRLLEGVDKISALDKNEAKQAAALIVDYKLPREVIPTELLNSADVWEALLADMPITALIRNLGKMTNVGLLASGSKHVKSVIERLGDQAVLRLGRVHPISVLIALKTYSQGRGFRGKLSWTPVPKIVDALDEAFYMAFDIVEPIGKRVLICADNSGSMVGTSCAGAESLSANEAAAAMCMLYLRTEEEAIALKFATGCSELKISKKTRLDDAIKALGGVGQGTDCSVPLAYALKHKIETDVIVEVTDSQTWAGTTHVSQAFERYCQATGIDAKFSVIQAANAKGSLCDPNNANMMDVAGFDGSVPLAIQAFTGKAARAEEVEVER